MSTGDALLPGEKGFPPNVLAYLTEQRLFSMETVGKFCRYMERGGEGETHGWIAIPVRKEGTILFHKLRAVPGNPAPNKMACEPAGAGVQLFGAGILKLENVNRVFICEGEMDAILMIQNNFPAVTSTAGAQSWQDEWCDLFPPSCEVVLCFDHDDAGNKGREKVRAAFHAKRTDIAISDIRFDEFDTKGFDLTDFFHACLAKNLDPRESLLSRIILPTEEGKKIRAIADVPEPTKDITVDEWQTTIRSYFPDLAFPAEVCASVIAQLLIHDVHNPFALVLTDAPATGKTICINFFDAIDQISYTTDNFTPAAFVSNIAGRSKKQLEEIDLLPRIRHKALLVRELAPMLSENDDALRARLGQLTRILDGEGFTVESGVYGQRGYQGEYNFMFIGASTPLPLRVWKVMSGMGHRLFFLALHGRRPDEEDLLMQTTGMPFKKKEKACKDATRDLLYGLWRRNKEGVDWDYEHDDEATRRLIAKLAIFVSKYRGEIKVWDDTDANGSVVRSTKPEIESPSRINTCLTNLARGHAVLMGRNFIEPDDLRVVLPVAIDTAPGERSGLMRVLLNNNGSAHLSLVTEKMNLSSSTAKKEMHKFIKLGICVGNIQQSILDDDEVPLQKALTHVSRPTNTIELVESHKWLLNETTTHIFEAIGIIDW